MNVATPLSLGLQVEDWRLKQHFKRVERILNAKDTSHLSPSLQAARRRNLDHLHEYASKGIFPRNTSGRYLYTPCFIDNGGRTCAVAELMVQSGAEEFAQQVNTQYHYARVHQMDSPELSAWADGSGLTVEELALIQPGYGLVGLLLWGGIAALPVFLLMTIINLRYVFKEGQYEDVSGCFIWLAAIGSFLTAAAAFIFGSIVLFGFFMSLHRPDNYGAQNLGMSLLVLTLGFLNFRGFQFSIRSLREQSTRQV